MSCLDFIVKIYINLLVLFMVNLYLEYLLVLVMSVGHYVAVKMIRLVLLEELAVILLETQLDHSP